jgi:hypothetical protein
MGCINQDTAKVTIPKFAFNTMPGSSKFGARRRTGFGFGFGATDIPYEQVGKVIMNLPIATCKVKGDSLAYAGAWDFNGPGLGIGCVNPKTQAVTPVQMNSSFNTVYKGFSSLHGSSNPGSSKSGTMPGSSKFGARRGRGRRVRSRFGFGAEGDFSNAGPADYGYNQPVVQKPGILNQSSQIVTSSTNASRPSGLGLPGEYTPTYGVYRPFFGENVPTQAGPNWNFMGQPDGSAFAVGGPFARYTSPASFGRRGRRGFGGGGCGSPFMKRNADGRCVFKSKAELKQRLKKAFSKSGKMSDFGGGGCGSPFMKRNADGRCVFKSKAELKQRLKKAFSKSR